MSQQKPMHDLKSFKKYRKAFLLQNYRNDFKIFKFLLECGKFIGMSPYDVHISEKVSLYKIFVFSLWLLYIIAFSYSFSIGLNIMKENNYEYVRIIVILVWRFLYTWFVSYCMVPSKRIEWLHLFFTLDKVEQIMDMFQYEWDSRSVRYLMELTLIWAIFIALQSVHLLHYYKSGLLLAFSVSVSWTWSHFYMICCFIFLIYTTRYVRNRYKLMKKAVIKLFGHIQEDAEVHYIKKVRRVLIYVENITDDFNNIFGWKIFFFLTISIIYIVKCITQMLLEVSTANFLKDSVTISLYMVCSLNSNINLDTCCSVVDAYVKLVVS